MGAPVKRKREQQEAPSASTSSTQVAKNTLDNVTWYSILSGIQGQKGEPGALEALNQLCRVITSQRSSASSKKSENEPAHRIWLDFLKHWQRDPGLKDVVAAWERGDQTGNNNLTTSALHVFANLLNVACSPSAGLIVLDSPYQPTLSSLIQELIPQLHYLTKYLNLPGKNDLATASLEIVGALLKLVRHGSARNATNRKIWEALNLDSRAICRLLGTKRKIPLINKHGRKPDIRHLMFNVLNNLLSPSGSLSMKIDVLNQKGVISAIFKGLSEDPVEVVEAILESMARLVTLPRLPLETRCRIAEDSWTEVLKLYARTEEERDPHSDTDTPAFPPAVTAQRYLLFVVSSLASASATLTPGQRKALGGLIGLLELSDSIEQAEVAAHILSVAPDLLPSFWSKFAPSLEPRLSSKWVTSVAFATRVVSSPLPEFLIKSLQQAQAKGSDSPIIPSIGTLLDTALMPPSLGKTWISKALQQSDTLPLVSYLTCQFLMAGMQKSTAILECMHSISTALQAKRDAAGATAWRSAAARLSADAADRLPDLQVLIALVQKTLGRAFSRASSVASVGTTSGSMEVDGEGVDDDNSLMTSLALRTIYLYRKLAPAVFSKLRFDFGKLLSSPFFASASETIAPLAAVGQSALLKIISLPADAETGEGAVSWAWSKSSDGGLSPVASIMRIYLSSPVESLRSVGEEAIVSLLSTSLLFEHDPSEIPLWLEALPRKEPAQLDVLVFFDNCLQRCLQTPYKYVDQIAEILSTNDTACKNNACRQASPLLATVLEQTLYRLTKEESAKPYLQFLGRLTIGLACHSACRCLLSSVLARLSTSLKETTGQTETKAMFGTYEQLAAVLLGKKGVKINASLSEDFSSLEELLVVASQRKSSDLNKQLLSIYKASSPTRRQHVARLAGYMLLNGHDLSGSLIPLAESGKSDPSIAPDLLAPILQLPEMPSFFEASAHLASPALDVLCHLINEVGRLDRTTAALLQPYAAILAHKANAETVVRCAAVVHDFSSQQLLILLARILKAPRTTAEEECMVLLCTTLSARTHEPEVFDAITQHADQLHDRKQDWCDVLLASWAEEHLPSGFGEAQQKRATRMQRGSLETAQSVLLSLASKSLQTGIRSAGIARVMAVSIYRSQKVWQQYSALPPVLSRKPDTSSTCLAYLEVATSSAQAQPASAVSQAILESALGMLLEPEVGGSKLRAHEIILLVVKSNKNLASAVSTKLQNILGQDAISHPERLTGENANFLGRLHAEVASFETFAVLEAFFNASLQWVVRRFAEDEENDKATAHLVTEISACLRKYPKKWLLKPHLVEPVVTATFQTRIHDAPSLLFTAALVSECKLQEQVYVKQMQALLADRRLRTHLQPASDARDSIVEVLQAFNLRSSGLFGQLNALPALLPFYQATLSKADQGLLSILRSTELQGGASMRSLVQSWVPWQLRGICTGPFQVLANLDPKLLYRGMSHVLQYGSETLSQHEAEETADPIFYLGMISCLLEEETLTRSNWLALISSNALGLAICSLASPHKACAIAGDRILARARNTLQSVDMREKDEILYLLDCVRNAILPATSTSTPGLPPLISLCIADALQAMASPEGFLYPAAWRWLLSRPVLDTDEVPLFYGFFYSTSDDRAVELKWLLKTLQAGVHTSDDWRLLRRRQIVELLIDYLQSGVATGDESLPTEILKTIAHLTKLPQPVHDLMTRSGFLGTLAIQKYHSNEERSTGIEIICNCISMAQPTKLRRARDGLWLADLLKGLTEAVSEDMTVHDLLKLCDILRRAAAHLASGSQEAQEIVSPCLIKLIKRAVRWISKDTDLIVSPGAVDLYDASMRLVGHIDADLFEEVTSVALQAQLKGVREELVKSWQQFSF